MHSLKESLDSEKAVLRQDAETKSLLGKYPDYTFLIPDISTRPRLLLSLSRDGQAPDPASLNTLTKPIKGLGKCTVKGFSVTIKLTGVIWSASSLAKRLSPALTQLGAALQAEGYENVCCECGTPGDTDACVVSGQPTILCDTCFCSRDLETQDRQFQQESVRENVLLGTAGAFLGGLLGVAAIVLLGMLGYIASLSGIVMGACALKGYKIFGKKLSKTGVIICVVLIILLVVFAYHLQFALEVSKIWKVDIITCFRMIPAIVLSLDFDKGPIVKDLLMLFLFTGLGAWSGLRTGVEKAHMSNLTKRLRSYSED
ncbi:MAG: hypothetical protein IJT76_06740 [Clostridia bacterium]|nr:hypothetical protein [Clostridia bacterium]